MKFIKLLSVVAVLGLISVSQVKAGVVLPGNQNLQAPTIVPGLSLKSNVVSAVPEPSDWAWVPVLATVGVIAWRRLSRRSEA